MKELSIEEKAKAYDEAIKVANKYKDTHIMFSQIKDEIFPELAESEDGKIRKWLIDTIKQVPNDSIEWETIDKSSVLAWLEKQGEQKLCVNDNAKEMFIKALERVEEQNNKGYKLTDCDKNSWWKDFKAYASCTIEQKPWSEEDDAIRNDLINYFRGSALETSEKEVINWLKSIKDRVQPQKQEWNDVDKDILFHIIDDLKFLDSVNIIDVEREINWLKSLRPQNNWKPSDEQMASITCAVRNMKESACYDSELVSLLNDLKNLK